MRKGFTLLEVLVASMLLAMLVTILTMIFNQSSIAWTTGTATVAGLSDTREKIAVLGNKAENLIFNRDESPKAMQITSVWSNKGDEILNNTGRTLSFETTELGTIQSKDVFTEKLNLNNAPWQQSVGSASAAGRTTFIVGVTSSGPNRTHGDWDDISTLPEEVVK